MYKFLYIVFLLILSLSLLITVTQSSKIELREVVSNLRCSKWGKYFEADKSSIVSNITKNMLCSSGSSFFTRLVMEVQTDSDTTTSNHQKEPISREILGSGSNGVKTSASNADGCRTKEPIIQVGQQASVGSEPECTKTSLPIQIPSTNLILRPGLGLKQVLEPKIKEMYDKGDFSNGNVRKEELNIDNVIQGIEIEANVSNTRWTYDLSQSPDHVMPFSYLVLINETLEAYEETVNSTKTGKTLTDGLHTTLSRCVPNILDESGRLGGKLDGCFRAGCNCSSLSQPNSIPEYYTFELHWVSPSCQMRKILNGGKPRLTATLDVNIYVVSKVAGVVVDRRSILKKRLWDITSDFPGSNTGGSTGISGKNGLDLIVNHKGGANGISVGSNEAELSNSLNPGVSSSQFQEILLRAEMKRVLQKISFDDIDGIEVDSSSINIGGDQNNLAFSTVPILSGAHIVDCLNDKEVIESEYRNSGVTPYNNPDLFPSDPDMPPKDKWFYMSDGISRDQHLFSTKLRNSCGFVGISSASIALDTKSLDDLCCRSDEPILSGNGACIPGGGHVNASNTPEQILSETEEAKQLYNELFSVPGWNGYNWFLNGRHTLNYQPVKQELSGDDEIINALPSVSYDMTLEISDVVLETLTGGVKSSTGIPPLRIEGPELTNAFQLVNKSAACVYSSDGSGRGVFIFQRLCNIGNSGSYANVSIEFEGCHGIELHDPEIHGYAKDLSGPYQWTGNTDPISEPLAPGRCYKNVMQSVFIPSAKGVTSLSALYDINFLDAPYCDRVILSSTKGSTREIVLNNFRCEPVYGTFGQSRDVKEKKANVLTERDIYISENCERCDSADLHCLQQCGLVYKSLFFWYTFVIPPIILISVLIFLVTRLILVNKRGIPKNS